MLCPEYSIHSIKWLNALANRGFEVHSCFCKGQNDNTVLLDSRVISHALPIKAPLGYYLNAIFLRMIVNRIKPDIIHIHRASSYATMARLAGVRCDILSIWGSDVYEFPYKKNRCKRILVNNLRYASCLASTSKVMADQARLFLFDQNVHIHVTPFGVDLKSFKPAKIEHQGMVVGTVKTLSEKYGIDVAIKAFASVVKQLYETGYGSIADEITYRIYGRGPLRSQLQELIESIDMKDKISLCGYIQNNEVPRILNSFDVFLLASNEESFGVSAVEAMACGLPVVATKAPGFLEVISDGITGLLVGIGDVDCMSKALYKLIINEGKRKKLGEKGREKVVACYDWENNVDQMIQLYKGVAKG